MKLRKKYLIKLSSVIPQLLLLLSIAVSNVFFPALAIAEEIEDLSKREVVVDESEDIIEDGGVSTSIFEEEAEEHLFSYIDGVYTVFNVEEEEYVYPGNEDVRVEFTSLSEEGDLVISRAELSDEDRELLNTSDEYGWSITSSMSNYSFTYNLTLPNSLNSDEVEVKYSEDGEVFNSIENVVVNNDVVRIEGLDHFTVFVVVNPIPYGGEDGDTCEVAGIEGECYETIQGAIDAAEEDDVVRVTDGTYDEDIVINQNKITVISANKHGATLRGLVTINANNVTFDGFKMREYQVSGGGFPVIEILGEDVTVQNLDMYLEDFISVQPYEIRIQSTADNAKILNNVINRGWFGGHPSISFAQGADILIEGNVLGGTGASAIGGGVGDGNTVIIRNNTVNYGYNEGIWFWPVHENGNIIVEGNAVLDYDHTDIGNSAFKVVSKPATINGYHNSADMYGSILEENPGIDTVLLQWMDNVHNYTQDTFYSTIQGAIDNANDGDNIKVYPGSYPESVTINVPNILLESVEGREDTIIENPDVGSEDPGIRVLADMGVVEVDGFTIYNFRNGIIQGMLSQDGTSFIVKNNKIIPENNDTSPYLRNGIQVTGEGSQVIGNYVIGAPLTSDWASSGIGVVNANNVLVQNNTVNTGGADIGISILNWDVSLVENIIVENNTVSNAGNGIRISGASPLREIESIRIENNDLIENNRGLNIQVLSLSDVSILRNDFIDNQSLAIRISSSANLSGDVLITYNNFINNNLYAVYNDSGQEVDATLNWWGHFTGPSGQGEGLGDSVSENVLYQEWLCEEYYTELESIDGVCMIQETPEQTGFNVNDGTPASTPREPNQFSCIGEFTNVNGVSVHWTDVSDGDSRILYQRQHSRDGENWTGNEIYTEPYTNYRSFGYGEVEHFSRVRAFFDTNGNGQYDEGEPVSGWSNVCSITYDVTPPDTPTGITIFDHEGNELGCNGYTNNRRITVSWDDNEENDFSHYIYGVKDNEFFRELEVSEYTGNIRDIDGVYKYRVRAVDFAGNISEPSDWCYVTLDREEPTTPSNLRFETTEGESLACSEYTNESYVVALWDESTDNSGIAYYQYRSFNPPDGWKWGTPTIHTTQRRGALNQGEGVYGFKVRAVDFAGNTSDWTAVDLESSCQITYDITAPIVTITSPSEGDYIRGTVDLMGDIEELNLWRYFYRVRNLDTGNNVTSRTVYSDSLSNETFYTWDTTQSDDGEYLIHLAARDLAGNRDSNSQYDITVVVDNTAPEGSIDYVYYSSRDVEVPTFITNDNTPVLGGTCSDNIDLDTVVLEINGQTHTIVCDEDTWRSNPLDVLPDGEHTATLTLTDLAGNETTYTQELIIDTVAPTAVHTYYRNGEEITDPIAYVQGVDELTFTGVYQDADPSSGLERDVFVVFRNHDLRAFCGWRQFILGGGVQLNGTDYHNLTEHQEISECVSFLEDGEYHIRHRVYDGAIRSTAPDYNQHRQYTRLQFVVDTIAPETTMTDISNTYHNSSILLQGVTEDENNVDYVQLYVSLAGENDWELLTTLDNEHNTPTFNWTYDWTPTDEGVYDIYASGVDVAGNVERTAIVYSVTYDTTDPEILNTSLMIDYLSTYVNGMTGFMISALVDDNLSGINPNSCEYTLDGSDWYSGTYMLNRCMFTVPSSRLFDGQALGVQVRVEDLAENRTTSQEINRTVDAETPDSEVLLDHDYYGPNMLPRVRGTATDTVSDVTNVMLTLRRNTDNRYWMMGGLWTRIPMMHSTVGTNNWLYDGVIPSMSNGITYTVTPFAWDQVHMIPGRGVSNSFTWDNQSPTVPQNLETNTLGVNCGSRTNKIVGFVWDASFDSLSGIKQYETSFLRPSSSIPMTNVTYETSFPSLVGFGSWGEGEYSFKVRAIDNVGNVSDWSDECTITYDVTPAEITWVQPEDGSIHNDAVVLQASTNETMNNFRFRWQLEGGSWVSGTNNTNQTDEYDYIFDPAEDGVYNLRAQGRDLALNWSRADDITITVDRTRPTGTIDTPENGEHINADVLISGTSDDNLSGVDRVEIRLRNYPDNTFRTDWVEADLDIDNNYSYIFDTTTIPEGDYEIAVVVYDNAGNNRWLWPRPVITVDRTPPIVEITSHEDGDLLRGEVEILGTIIEENLSHYNLSLNPDPEGMCNKDDTWNFSNRVWQSGGSSNTVDYTLDTTAFEDGTYMIRLAARDLAGNRDPMNPPGDGDSVEVICITIDNTAPVLSQVDDFNLLQGTDLEPVIVEIVENVGLEKVCVNLPAYSLEYCDDTIESDIEEYDFMQLVIDNLSTTIVDTTIMPIGIYEVEYYAYDLAGNQSELMQVEVEVVINEPNIEILGETTATAGDPPLTFTTEVTGGTQPYTYLWSGNCTGTLDTTTFNPTTAGTYTCTVLITDFFGNTDTDSLTITVDAPEVLGTETTATTRRTTTQGVLGVGGPDEGDEISLLGEDVTDEEILGVEDITNCEQPVKVYGYLFIDKNNNGVLDDNEDILSEVSLRIFYPYNGNEITVKELETDENGYWETTLCPAEYKIAVDTTNIPDHIDIEEVLSLTVGEDDEEIQFNIPGVDSRTFWQIYWYIILILSALFLTVSYVILSNRRKN